MSTGKRLPIVNATIIVSLFLEFLDQTIITTALPVVARDYGISPLDLKFGLTSYYLALVLVIPASGWIGERFGPRKIFLLAMLLFSLGSLFCGLSGSLAALVASRFVQGVGGALLVPVGRLIILRDVPPGAMITTLAWLSLPAVFGPMLGPLVGGTMTTFLHWRWIFWVNLPLGLMAFVLAAIYFPRTDGTVTNKFDTKGYAIVSSGLTLLVGGSALIIHGAVTPVIGVLCCIAGISMLPFYARHAANCSKTVVCLRPVRFADVSLEPPRRHSVPYRQWRHPVHAADLLSDRTRVFAIPLWRARIFIGCRCHVHEFAHRRTAELVRISRTASDQWADLRSSTRHTDGGHTVLLVRRHARVPLRIRPFSRCAIFLHHRAIPMPAYARSRYPQRRAL